MRQVCLQEKKTALSGPVKVSVFSRTKSVSQVFFHCLSMHRFVSERSSSSADLDSSSLDDMRAEQAAIALSVGLSWPLDRRWSPGRPS